MFDDTSSHTKLQNAVPALVDWRLSKALLSAYYESAIAKSLIQSMYFLFTSIRECLYLLREVSKIGKGLSVYFTAVTFLHVAFKINRNPLTDEMLDVLSTLCHVYSLMVHVVVSMCDTSVYCH